jgi:hypothetical protein
MVKMGMIESVTLKSFWINSMAPEGREEAKVELVTRRIQRNEIQYLLACGNTHTHTHTWSVPDDFDGGQKMFLTLDQL